MQQLVTRPARVQSARLTQAQDRLDVAWQERQTAITARQAVRDLAAYRAQRAVAVELAGRLQNYVGESKAAVDCGDLTITDFADAQTAARDARRHSQQIGTLRPAVTIALPIFDRTRGAIAIERATRQRRYEEYVARLFTARSDLAAALAEVSMIARQITAAARSVDSRTTLVSAYRAAGRERDIDVFTLYLAENDLAQKRIDLLELRQTRLAAHAAVKLAAGVFLPEEVPPTTREASP